MDKKKKITIMLLIAGIIISIILGLKVFSNPAYFNNTINYLDGKRNTVLGLTAASSASSVALTLIPGDIATPIADQLADLSGLFILILGAIYLEKYLITIGGLFSFCILIPFILILQLARTINVNFNFRNLQKKLLILSTVFILLIPISCIVGNTIEATYNHNYEKVIEEANNNSEEIEDQSDSSLWDKVSDALDVNKYIDKAEDTLNNFIESVAVMIITSCVIPIMVLFGLLWTVKTVVGITFESPKMISKNPIKKINHSIKSSDDL